LPSKTLLSILSFRSVLIPPTLSFKSLGYGVIKPFYFVFLALSSSKDKTIVYLVDRIVVNKEVDKNG
jgi:hypothetical protein